MRTLYFSHSYNPKYRPFNEHIWNLLLKKGFQAMIDTGLDQGWHGNRWPMEISFNEWMLSRCDGFVAVLPNGESQYQKLEYRLALRMGLPTLLFMQEGGGLGTMYAEPHGFPGSWQRFWQKGTQDALESAIDGFAKSVEAYRETHAELASIGLWLPRANEGDLTIGLLQPIEDATEWFSLQLLLKDEAPRYTWYVYPPTNFSHPHDLILTTSQKIDLLVLDVGPRGTPRELVGYLDGLGIPQFRVCKVADQMEADELGKHLSGKQRFPYRQESDQRTLPRLLDGLKLDEQMEPVFFWQSWPQLAERLKSLMVRIEQFRSGLSVEKGGSRIEVDTRESSKKYFSQRYHNTQLGNVFISFAGSGGATSLAGRLAPILRFLDCRCFQYRDPDSTSEGRLESGELIMAGLQLRVDQADVVVLFLDQKYLDSPYCTAEMQQALELRRKGRLEIRAYTTEKLKLPDEMKDINPFEHQGQWTDEVLEEKIVKDILESVNSIRWPLREEERSKLRQWLIDDDQNNGTAVRRLLVQSGVKDSDIDSQEIDWSKDSWFESFLYLPESPEKRQRRRELIALLILALVERTPDRLATARIWLLQRRLLPRAPRLVVLDEEVVTIDPGLTSMGLTVQLAEKIAVGQSLREKVPNVLIGRHRLILDAEPRSLEVPIEWTRENAETKPVAVRRPICWRLPFEKTRKCFFETFSSSELPPTILILALESDDITPEAEQRELKERIDKIYRKNYWPPELIRSRVCKTVQDLESRLTNCMEQVVHVAGHIGSKGLRVSSDILTSEKVARALSNSDVRLIVLNGCDGGTPQSPLAFEYATLAECLVRDGNVPEIVAHRGPLRDDDGLAFALTFYESFFSQFDPARAAFEARRTGSEDLEYSPIVISQRGKKTNE